MKITYSPTNPDEMMLILAVRQIATERSETSPVWADVNTCMFDGDILEYLSNANFDLPKALKAIESWVYREVNAGHKREYNPDNYRGI